MRTCGSQNFMNLEAMPYGYGVVTFDIAGFGSTGGWLSILRLGYPKRDHNLDNYLGGHVSRLHIQGRQ